MHDLPYRAAIAALVAAGFSMLAMALLADWPVVAGDSLALVWQGRLLQGLLGVGLLLAAFVPALRLAVMGGAILSKAGLLVLALAGASVAPWVDAAVLALLVPSAAVFALAARRNARWEGVLPLRLEA